ncbi:hypothetical protein BGX28_004637 [Mortierella sp. GBA30]|nr:hypothetical protein BGX28_004637 [Mortierella sp. GBA30]
MKVLWSKFTSVAVIALAVSLSHLNSAAANSVSHGVDYAQHHHHHYVERDLQSSQEQQDDGSVVAPAVDSDEIEYYAEDTSNDVFFPTVAPGECDSLVGTFAALVDGVFNTTLNLLRPIPAASFIVGALEGLAKGITADVTDVGKLAALTVTSLNLTVTVLREFQVTLSKDFGIPSVLFDTAFGFFQTVISLASKVASCKGAPVDCKSILPVLGYIIQTALPILKSLVPSDLATQVNPILQKIADTAQDVIKGTEGAINALKGAVNLLADLTGKLPPAFKFALEFFNALVQGSC